MRIAAVNNSDETGRTPTGAAATLIDQVEVTLEAYLGKAQLAIADVRTLKPDSVVTLDASLGAAVELRLNGAVVARGELVAVGDKFGVRLIEIGK